MKIGVVIPTVDLWSKFTKPCIDSIKSKHELYFVLVDNNSKDETYVEATKLITPEFHYKRNTENWGCAKSWNYGIRDCLINRGCDYCLVINNDVLLHPNAIDRLVDRFEKAKEHTIGIKERGYNIMWEEEWIDLSESAGYKKILESERLVMVTCLNVRGECTFPSSIFTLDDKEKEGTPESEHPDFSGFMINKRCWDEVGEIDEGLYPAYWEDDDYHKRIRLLGLKAICYPPALFYHYAGSNTWNKDLNPLTAIIKSQKFEANKMYYVEKWGGLQYNEKYTNPFNDSKKDVKWTYQSRHKDKCDCDIECQLIVDMLKNKGKQFYD